MAVRIKYSKELDLLPPRPLFFPNLFECITFCLPKPIPPRMHSTPRGGGLKQLQYSKDTEEECAAAEDVPIQESQAKPMSSALSKKMALYPELFDLPRDRPQAKLLSPSSISTTSTNNGDRDDLSEIPMLELEVSESASDYAGDDDMDALLDQCDFMTFKNAAATAMKNNPNNKFGGLALGFCQILLTLIVMEQFWQLSRRRYW